MPVAAGLGGSAGAGSGGGVGLPRLGRRPVVARDALLRQARLLAVQAPEVANRKTLRSTFPSSEVDAEGPLLGLALVYHCDDIMPPP